MQEVVIDKRYVILAALVLALIPWFSGASNPGGIFIGLGLVILGGYVAWRSPAIKPLRWGVVPIAYWALVLWSALSLIWSVNRYQTALWLVELLLAGGIFVLARRLGRERRDRSLWVYGYLAVATVTSLWGIADYLTDAGFDRLTSWFNWPNPFAIFVLPAIMLAGLAVLQRRHWRPMAVVAVINLAAFGLATSRTATLLLALVVVVTLILRRSKRWLIDCVILLAVAVLLVSGTNYLRTHLFHIKTSATITGRFVQAAEGQSTSLSDRIYFLRSAADDWRAHPLLGSGAGTYATVHPAYQYRVISASSQAHNLYVQLFGELGLVGGVLLIVLALGLCLQAYRAGRRSPANLVFAVALVALLVHLGMDIDSLYGTVVILIASLAGLVYQEDAAGYRLPKRVGEAAKLALAIVLLVATVQSYHVFYAALQARNAQSFQDDGEYALAAAGFDRAAAGPFGNPNDLTDAGINYYTLGQQKHNLLDLVTAAARAQTAIKQDRLDAQHYFLLARIQRVQGNLTAAAGNYRLAIAKDPYNHPEYYSDLVELYLTGNHLSQAQALLSQALPRYDTATVTNRSFIPGFAQSVVQLELDQIVAAESQGNSQLAKAAQQRINQLQKIAAAATPAN